MRQDDPHRYDDIIDLPHHQSATRPHMPLIDRAAQFSPFAALTGYEMVITETARPLIGSNWTRTQRRLSHESSKSS